jgi:hypothetical protein
VNDKIEVQELTGRCVVVGYMYRVVGMQSGLAEPCVVVMGVHFRLSKCWVVGGNCIVREICVPKCLIQIKR